MVNLGPLRLDNSRYAPEQETTAVDLEKGGSLARGLGRLEDDKGDRASVGLNLGSLDGDLGRVGHGRRGDSGKEGTSSIGSSGVLVRSYRQKRNSRLDLAR
jgi:hypothetical protein